MCEQLTKEIMELKSRRRELEAERHLFHKKAKRAKRRVERKGNETHLTPATVVDQSHQ